MKKEKVAYFCMEFGLNEELKIYSGGLGILAGDILKAAKDEEASMVGVGILWRQGYCEQYIGKDGKAYESYKEYHYDFLKDTGIEVSVTVRGREVKCKVWECTKYGNVPLYLLDANVEGNADRLITGQLYGWFSEERVAQEMILSIGGVRALKALGIEADIYHFNDSHPVPAGIELIVNKMNKDKLTFEQAWVATRKQIVFTTHTPVEAGNELHQHELLQYMGMYNGLSYEEMVQLGGEPFSMTAAGLRLSYIANGVAELHGETARKMWKKVDGGSEILSITNGVHNGTWQDSSIVEAYKNKTDLIAPHEALKKDLLEEVKKRNSIQLEPNVLTIGFARRAAPYKRSDLVFSRPEEIEPLLKEKKVQFIFSGKAHPNDLDGKAIISRLYEMTKKYPQSVVFVENYDMQIGRLMTRGADVWLNNPIKPMEASGTSGMKAAMNGVLNFSVLDGWWPEGCEHGVNGWEIGSGYEGEDCNKVDTDSLFKTLKEEIIPTFYDDKEKWQTMMRNSIEMSSVKFSAARMVRDYYEKMYSKQKDLS